MIHFLLKFTCLKCCAYGTSLPHLYESLRIFLNLGTCFKYAFFLMNMFGDFKLKKRMYFNRSSGPEVFLERGIPKIFKKLTRKHPRRNVISIKLLCNFIEIVFWQVLVLLSNCCIFSEHVSLRIPQDCCS